jgi:hypothetical protein
MPTLPEQGYVVSAAGIGTDEEKISAVKNWPVPRSVTEVRAYTGVCFHYRKFIGASAEIAAPLHASTKKKRTVHLDYLHQTAFDDLKGRLTCAPVLAVPNDSD